MADTPLDDPESRLTDAAHAELTASSAITPEDVGRAQAQWRTDAPRELRDLLDAADADVSPTEGA